MFTLILTDPQFEMVAAWQAAFADHPEVEIHNEYFEKIETYDCMVSAANSFGLMDGGVDLAIINYFGQQLESRVQQYIIDHYRGEQPVGTSFLIETQHPTHPWIAHTPTMRVPMNIHRTDNVYLAMKAMLEAIWKHNQQEGVAPINQVVCPGLGTLTGRVPFDEAARQMALAYTTFLNPPDRIHWGYATKRQNQIRYGGKFGL